MVFRCWFAVGLVFRSFVDVQPSGGCCSAVSAGWRVCLGICAMLCKKAVYLAVIVRWAARYVVDVGLSAGTCAGHPQQIPYPGTRVRGEYAELPDLSVRGTIQSAVQPPGRPAANPSCSPVAPPPHLSSCVCRQAAYSRFNRRGCSADTSQPSAISVLRSALLNCAQSSCSMRSGRIVSVRASASSRRKRSTFP